MSVWAVGIGSITGGAPGSKRGVAEDEIAIKARMEWRNAQPNRQPFYGNPLFCKK